MNKVEETLQNREGQYGSFEDVATTAQDLKEIMRDQGVYNAVQIEAIELICTKLARIKQNPSHLDSWHDISGYATLVCKELEGK